MPETMPSDTSPGSRSARSLIRMDIQRSNWRCALSMIGTRRVAPRREYAAERSRIQVFGRQILALAESPLVTRLLMQILGKCLSETVGKSL